MQEILRSGRPGRANSDGFAANFGRGTLRLSGYYGEIAVRKGKTPAQIAVLGWRLHLQTGGMSFSKRIVIRNIRSYTAYLVEICGLIWKKDSDLAGGFHLEAVHGVASLGDVDGIVAVRHQFHLLLQISCGQTRRGSLPPHLILTPVLFPHFSAICWQCFRILFQFFRSILQRRITADLFIPIIFAACRCVQYIKSTRCF